MRKMTIQEDSAVCESIVTMPKTPYLRYLKSQCLTSFFWYIDRSSAYLIRKAISSCQSLNTWKTNLREASRVYKKWILGLTPTTEMTQTKAASICLLHLGNQHWSPGSVSCKNARRDKKLVLLPSLANLSTESLSDSFQPLFAHFLAPNTTVQTTLCISRVNFGRAKT